MISNLVHAVDFPVSATSANLSGNPDCITIEELNKLFGDTVALYVDGGTLDGEASTVVDVSSEDIVLLREGAIKFEELKKYWK